MSEKQYTLYSTTLQLRKLNKKGRLTLRFVWDIISRDDIPDRLLIESWGGRAGGYLKWFRGEESVNHYLQKRLGKVTCKDDHLRYGVTTGGRIQLDGSNGVWTVTDNSVGSKLMEDIGKAPTSEKVLEIAGLERGSDWSEATSFDTYMKSSFKGSSYDSDGVYKVMLKRIADKIGDHGWQDSIVESMTFMQSGGDMSDVVAVDEDEGVKYTPHTTDLTKKVFDKVNKSVRAPAPAEAPTEFGKDLAEVLDDSEPMPKVKAPNTHEKDYEKWGAWS